MYMRTTTDKIYDINPALGRPDHILNCPAGSLFVFICGVRKRKRKSNLLSSFGTAIRPYLKLLGAKKKPGLLPELPEASTFRVVQYGGLVQQKIHLYNEFQFMQTSAEEGGHCVVQIPALYERPTSETAKTYSSLTFPLCCLKPFYQFNGFFHLYAVIVESKAKSLRISQNYYLDVKPRFKNRPITFGKSY